MNLLLLVLFCFFCSIFAVAPKTIEEDEWSFIVLADWHGAEGFAQFRDKIQGYNESIRVLSHIKDNYGGDLVMMPGDTNHGKWYLKDNIEKLMNNHNLDSLTPNEAIELAGHNCYSTLKDVFSKAGYDTILLAFGDHELGGNPWTIGTDHHKGIPTFQDVFTDEINTVKDPDRGETFKFPDPIRNVPSRPFGTVFNMTSYAYAHENALFITVDVFNFVRKGYYDRATGEGGEGAVDVTVIGEHLEWFENILIEGNNDDGIDHIFVQAHFPIMQPVRKINCSAMFFNKGIKSDFWKLMRQYGVDVYFAGEVHALTVLKDPESDLIQIASRGNRFNNFLRVGSIRKDGFRIEAFNEVGKKWRWNANYTKYGELNVTKLENGKTIINDSGALKIVDANAGPLIRFDFYKKDSYPLNSRQIIGMKYDNYQNKLIGNRKTIRGIKSYTGLENHGMFGRLYDAQIANLDFEEGNRTKGIGVFIQDTRFAISGMGPLAAGKAFSFTIQFSTQKTDSMILFSYGYAFAPGSSLTFKDLFLVTLEGGQYIKIYTNEQTFIRYSISRRGSLVNLSDGEWHKVFITMPSDSCLLSEVVVYLDGITMTTELRGIDRNLFIIPSGRLSLGGWGYSFNMLGTTYFQNITNFEGKIKTFQLSMKDIDDGFKIHYNRRCRKPVKDILSGTILEIGRMAYEDCLNECQMKSSASTSTNAICKGFESLRSYEPDELPLCTLFTKKKPRIYQKNVKSGSKCAILKKK